MYIKATTAICSKVQHLSCKYLQQNQHIESKKVDFQNFSNGDHSSSNYSLKLKNSV